MSHPTPESMTPSSEEIQIGGRYRLMSPHLNERERRLFAASEVRVLGGRSISLVSRATGLSRAAIRRGLEELDHPEETATGRVRQKGGGRKSILEVYPTLREALERLLEPYTRGDPQSPLRWTTKSTRQILAELQHLGFDINSPQTVADLLHELGYSLQATDKTLEGGDHPDRNEQFEYIYRQLGEHQQSGQPVISVDAKKRELVGNFDNNGREWHQKGEPPKTNVYDFASLAEGKATPYGVFDILHNEGWVSVGTDHNTAMFAVATIERWWEEMGALAYPAANKLLIVADGGGSNGSRNRLWKAELQAMADETGMEITVCHFPPGTSKWNHIEHRMFSFISKNWRGKPLLSYEVIVQLIGNTKTSKGLKIRADLDTADYPTGLKVSDDEFNAINITRHDFHGEWNYTISPVKTLAHQSA